MYKDKLMAKSFVSMNQIDSQQFEMHDLFLKNMALGAIKRNIIESQATFGCVSEPKLI